MPGTDREAEETGLGVAPASALHQVLTEARDAGFLGPGPIEPHLLHAEGFLALARRHSPIRAEPYRVLDLGSGGGLPGLVVALGWPESILVLLDSGARRAGFLRRAVERCGLFDRVTVVQQRAELCGRDPDFRGTFDGVVVRSFGPPAVVAECGAPLLRPGGWMIVSEPPAAAEGSPDLDPGSDFNPDREPGTEAGPLARWPKGPLAQFGLEPLEFVREQFGYQVLRQATLCPDRFPRRNGVPAKHPLFTSGA